MDMFSLGILFCVVLFTLFFVWRLVLWSKSRTRRNTYTGTSVNNASRVDPRILPEVENVQEYPRSDRPNTIHPVAPVGASPVIEETLLPNQVDPTTETNARTNFTDAAIGTTSTIEPYTDDSSIDARDHDSNVQLKSYI